ncbi:E2F-associated phosphoprotein-like [Anneissia japonica]|uniref:E2F-associated phosphoprotein-like n=1 Tax=Anneissia japonica TaxID=1529436 RepID=UPI00142596BC|nr:E2F-associated phosphoprotein-like [Anneissia japonica]
MTDYIIYEDSDEECAGGQQSSEDELDILLHGTPERKRKLTRSLSRGSLQLSSSEDEFEKEMEKELDETMRQHEKRQFSKLKCEEGSTSQNSKPLGQSTENAAEECYDDIYFDSDEEDAKTGKSKHKVLTNEELMYDPDIDDDNQQWIDKQRKMYHPNQLPSGSDPSSAGSSRTTTKVSNKAPLSDAVLNCPACMTTLCLDCQRHEKYHQQFRAMFVLNCKIIHSEILRYKPNVRKQQRHRKKRKSTDEDNVAESSSETEEVFHPVRCSMCNTEVAMYDKEEVYHFFNVLSSVA